jgi:hypothetical protein
MSSTPTPTQLLVRKKITAIYADGSAKMNLGIATVVRMLKEATNVPAEVAADAAARKLLAELARSAGRTVERASAAFDRPHHIEDASGNSVAAKSLKWKRARSPVASEPHPARKDRPSADAPDWEATERSAALLCELHLSSRELDKIPPRRRQVEWQRERRDRRANGGVFDRFFDLLEIVGLDGDGGQTRSRWRGRGLALGTAVSRLSEKRSRYRKGRGSELFNQDSLPAIHRRGASRLRLGVVEPNEPRAKATLRTSFNRPLKDMIDRKEVLAHLINGERHYTPCTTSSAVTIFWRMPMTTLD